MCVNENKLGPSVSCKYCISRLVRIESRQLVTNGYCAVPGRRTHSPPHTPHHIFLYPLRGVMGPKAPDWSYLQSLQGDSLEEEDIDKVYSHCFGKA